MEGIKMMDYSDENLPTKMRINLSLDIMMIREAQYQGLNLSRAAEQGINAALELTKSGTKN